MGKSPNDFVSLAKKVKKKFPNHLCGLKVLNALRRAYLVGARVQVELPFRQIGHLQQSEIGEVLLVDVGVELGAHPEEGAMRGEGAREEDAIGGARQRRASTRRKERKRDGVGARPRVDVGWAAENTQRERMISLSGNFYALISPHYKI